jgi:hypothetical protein
VGAGTTRSCIPEWRTARSAARSRPGAASAPGQSQGASSRLPAQDPKGAAPGTQLATAIVEGAWQETIRATSADSFTDEESESEVQLRAGPLTKYYVVAPSHDRVIPSPGRAKPYAARGLALLGLTGRPLPARSTGAAHRVPDRGDEPQ